MLIMFIISFVIALLLFSFSYFANRNLLSSSIFAGFAFLVTLLSQWLGKKGNPFSVRKIVFTGIGLGIGLIFGLIISNLLKSVLENFSISPEGLFYLIGVVTFLSSVAGYLYGTLQPSNVVKVQEQQEKFTGSEKILDSSVIIDGRILKIAKTNFIEGTLVIPNFVLKEIQLISDSPDPIKRNRGRRGLDLLNELQQLNNIKVKITYNEYPEIRDVDSKLIQLVRDTGGKLITNDFNLEKVAEVHGVQVLNLNALAEALRPIVLPGEELKIQIIKEGKDENQGVGYLDDGTMVVIEDGRELIGKLVKVMVTSIIQTAAGKMIFTKAIAPVSEEELAEEAATSEKESKNRKILKEAFTKKPKIK